MADVVETLIGATYVDSNMPFARACINIFLPEIREKEPHSKLTTRPSRSVCSSMFGNMRSLELLQKLIHYDFKDLSMLGEAFTHPSCERDTVTESHQRLEFLGDSVLDIIIASSLFQHQRAFSAGQTTATKAALVNGVIST